MINKQIKDYLIISELGSGGMATVYLAKHQLLQSQVAIKVLNHEFVRNENIRKRFLVEARNMARMSHQHIVKVTDLIEEGDFVAFVMEYIDGETLKDYLARKGGLSDSEIGHILSQILEALKYVHSGGLIHRDIKPSNFMKDRSGNVKLMDFGIAKNTDASSAEYTQTGTGVQMGTPMYMSPEQITETRGVTAQSDIYSLGVMVWQMVSGRKPYDSATLSDFNLKSKIINEQLPATQSVWSSMIERATEKKLEKRYASVEEMITQLDQVRVAGRNPLASASDAPDQQQVAIQRDAKQGITHQFGRVIGRQIARVVYTKQDAHQVVNTHQDATQLALPGSEIPSKTGSAASGASGKSSGGKVGFKLLMIGLSLIGFLFLLFILVTNINDSSATYPDSSVESTYDADDYNEDAEDEDKRKDSLRTEVDQNDEWPNTSSSPMVAIDSTVKVVEGSLKQYEKATVVDSAYIYK